MKMKTKLIACQPITKGWSADQKFLAVDEHGQKFLLRIALVEKLADKQAEFALLKILFERNLPVQKTVELTYDGQSVYQIFEWIEGEDLRQATPNLSDETLYELGCQAGKLLKVLHQIPIDQTSLNWESYYQAKIDKKTADYQTASHAYEQGQAMLEFIERSRHLVGGRPIAYHHGDFHDGNMLVGQDGQLYLLDFDRFDKGDPWEEFNRLIFTVETSPALARGMLDAYFEEAIPEEFWQLLALYLTVNSIGALVWAEEVNPDQIPLMKTQAKQLFDWYQGYKEVIPSWYLGKNR
ncbi:aminoglycoside phosphotransferase family protein [Streptococcus suis]|uniref:aminoglycoside phosphotransferase family protein n=1 Tax=Streptococcus suis TaxID=1307 RepID=UPI001EE766FE|nr:phosphotransferase [Streptococcus suis]